jgi:hypothetical protein
MVNCRYCGKTLANNNTFMGGNTSSRLKDMCFPLTTVCYCFAADYMFRPLRTHIESYTGTFYISIVTVMNTKR